MQCPKCNTLNSVDSRFCKQCGAPLDATTQRAPAPIVDGHEREKVEQIVAVLGGLNCGRCGHRTCAENAAAIVRGESPMDSCVQGGADAARRIRQILGQPERLRLGSLLWEQLTSIKLAITLIILLVLLSIVGTLIPQGKEPFFYAERYGLNGQRFIQLLQIDQLYHTWYFLSLLALLAVNTLSCATKRFRVSWEMLRRPVEARRPEEIAELPSHTRLEAGETSLDALEQVLGRWHYRVERTQTELWARKNLWGRLGVDLLHASLIVVLVGGIVGAFWGFEDFQVAHKGETFKVARGGFDVRVDDLWSANYQNSSEIKGWYTKLTVIDDGREVFTKSIRVNDPLSYKGISFYQASFGTDWLSKAQLTFRIEWTQDTVSPGPLGAGNGMGEAMRKLRMSREVTAQAGTEFTLDEGKRKVRVSAFYPDLVMTDQGPANRSQRLDNPAAYLEIFASDKPDKPEFSTWTFAQYPKFQHEFAQGNPYRFYLTGMAAAEFTGLQIAGNPGIGLIYGGFGLLMLGLFLNFYLPPRRIWAAVKENEIYLGGLGREPREFEPELEQITEEFKRKNVSTTSRESGEPVTSGAQTS